MEQILPCPPARIVQLFHRLLGKERGERAAGMAVQVSHDGARDAELVLTGDSPTIEMVHVKKGEPSEYRVIVFEDSVELRLLLFIRCELYVEIDPLQSRLCPLLEVLRIPGENELWSDILLPPPDLPVRLEDFLKRPALLGKVNVVEGQRKGTPQRRRVLNPGLAELCPRYRADMPPSQQAERELDEGGLPVLGMAKNVQDLGPTGVHQRVRPPPEL